MALQKITGDIIADGAIPKDAIANDAIGLDQLDVNIGLGASEGQAIFIDSSGGLVLDFPSSGGGGKVLQCVSFTKTDTFSTTNQFNTNTGLEVDITPQEQTSSCLVMINFDYSMSGSQAASGRIFRLGNNAIVLGISDTASSHPDGTFNLRFPFVGGDDKWTQSCGMTFQDIHNAPLDAFGQPITLTYGLEVRCLNPSVPVSNGFKLNHTTADPDSIDGGRAVSTITVMEIEAPPALGGGGSDGGFGL